MRRMLSLVVVVAAALVVLVAGSHGAEAAGPPTTCTANLTIFTTSLGDVKVSGPVTHYRDSGVGGQYTSGFLAGYTISGAQDIMVNSVTNQSRLNGSFLVSGTGGTFTLKYTGGVDLNTGRATGQFVAKDGTGDFAGLHWQGTTEGQLISLTPPTFLITDSGKCHTTP